MTDFMKRYQSTESFSSDSSSSDGEDDPETPTFVHPNCSAFQAYFLTRDWKTVSQYWGNLLLQDPQTWPSFVQGNETYGLTDIHKLFQAGNRGEFSSTDQRYLRRKTYAIRIGYRGDAYHGYQWQNNVDRVPKDHSGGGKGERRTVEGDLTRILNATCFGAGRTDRGVHALSQVVCFGKNDEDFDQYNQKNPTADGEPENSGNDFLERLKASDAWQDGRLRVFQCYRVPKRFHSRSSALWRRYLYLFPLDIAEKNRNLTIAPSIEDSSNLENHISDSRRVIEYAIDIDRLNRILSE
jgi:tRNA pseudouridine(38-40) synthase